MAQLSIVVPVYNGAEDLERCLASLARCRPADSEILLHDDASTDPRIATMLRSFAAEQPGVRILAARENRGFVASCNAATAAAAPGADILLLNSDTELTRGAIEEMRDRMHESGAAACCPMSSNATFLSLPKFQQPNSLPEGWSAEDMAAHVRAAADETGEDLRWVGIPTPVGFCMLVRRDAWTRWGPFDEAFGMGYAEEDDFGQRALAGGERLIAATRAYVWHRGSASFGMSPQLAEHRKRNGRLLLSRWPQYPFRVRAFCERNPFRPMLERLWDRVLATPETRGRHVLHLVPRWELQGALRDGVLRLAQGARALANHTVVVPTPNRGSWLDGIDFETWPGVRVYGLIDFFDHLAHFVDASTATHVHIHNAEEWDTHRVARALEGARRRLLDAAGFLQAHR